MNRALPQPIEPSQGSGPEARWENLAHQRVIMGVQRHHLDIVTDVFYRVSLSIVRIEWRACESIRHWGALDIRREW